MKWRHTNPSVDYPTLIRCVLAHGKALRWIPLVMAVMITTGCLKSTPETHYYILNSPDSMQPLQKATKKHRKRVVEIASLTLPQYLERTQIVTRTSTNRMKIKEFHRWGGNLRKNMSRVMAKNLSRLLNTPHMLVVPHIDRTPVDFRLQMEVLEFELGPSQQVNLSVRWTLTKRRRSTPVAVRLSELSSPKIEDADMDQTVSAMGELYGELSREIARAIKDHGG